MMVLVLDYLSLHVLCCFRHACSWVVLDVLSVACLGDQGYCFCLCCSVLSGESDSSTFGLSKLYLFGAFVRSHPSRDVEVLVSRVKAIFALNWNFMREVGSLLSFTWFGGKTLWDNLLMRNFAWGDLSSSFALLGCWSFSRVPFIE